MPVEGCARLWGHLLQGASPLTVSGPHVSQASGFCAGLKGAGERGCGGDGAEEGEQRTQDRGLLAEPWRDAMHFWWKQGSSMQARGLLEKGLHWRTRLCQGGEALADKGRTMQ